MPRLSVLPLLLCAYAWTCGWSCAGRSLDDDGLDGSEGATADETTTGPNTTPPPPPSDESTTTSDTTTTTAGNPTAPTATATFTSGDPSSSFEDDVQPIFDEHCVSFCHEPDGEWGFLLDLSGSAYDAIVGVPAPQHASLLLVEPGDPDSSYLWHKINGTQDAVGGSGLTMPKPRADMRPTVLTLEQIATIEQWILNGAEP